ncbi:MAG: hypothetical protein KGI07_08350 [Thaumarchaeota archaeon]|nr:hypothetical protein [Nitrososphaerota archaeon]
MKYRTTRIQLMWPYDVRKMMEILGHPIDTMNSPFAFPRLPPRTNPPHGISSAGMVKDSIVKDVNMMTSKLSGHHTMFQRYAAGLFNMTPNGFMPGHPMHATMQTVDTLTEENDRLKKENMALRSDLGKEKKK